MAPPAASAAQACGLPGVLGQLDATLRAIIAPLLSLTCTANSDPLVFGSFNALQSSPITSNGNVAVTCAYSLLGTQISLPGILVCYEIKLSAGGGTYATRKLTGPNASTLSYNAYTSGSYTSVWGDGSASTVTMTDSYLLALGIATKNYTVFGRLSLPQPAQSGSYTDSITVTVDY